jgi:glycosyltransferase involved in cell wall biosynthesis
MNIALVVYSHYSRDARVRRYTESISRKGFGVDVVCLEEDYSPKERNITLIKYPIPRRRLGRLWYLTEYFLFFLYSFFALAAKYPSKKYKIIHINNMPDILVFSAIIPKLFGAKIILDMHDPMPELYISKYHGKENGCMVKLLERLEKVSFSFADKIITANEAFKSLFLKRNKISLDKISVVLNCPDPRIFSNEVEPPRRFDLSRNKHFTLLYMGTVDERFGLDIVIKTIPQLIRKIPNIQFMIVPKLEEEGEYFNYLKSQISNLKLEKCVKILTPQPLENIVNHVKNADIGIVLAKNGVFTENIFPVKLLEFVQIGIPVIATKTKILGQYFSNNQICFLKKNTPDEFTETVIKLYKNKDLRQKLSKAAKQYLKEYNWQKEERKYLNIVDSLIRPK